MKKYILQPSNLVALVLLSLLWALFFWRLLTPNPLDREIFPEGDFTLHYFAFSDYQAERLQNGELPLWNPYNHSGDSFVGNIQFVAWYPPRWIAIFLSRTWSIEAYQLEVALHYWLVSLMMYAFLCLLVKRPSVALIGSILYSYSGYLTGYPMLQVSVLESVAWTPLVLFGLEVSMKKPEFAVRGVSLAGLGIALSFLGGHPQTTLQICYLGGAYLAYGLYIGRIGFLGFLLRGFLFGAFGIGLALIQLLPALEFAGLSAREASYGYLDKANGFQVKDFLQLFYPYNGTWTPLYIGVAGLILAGGALLRPNKTHAFWLATVIVGLFLSLGGNSIVYDLFYNVLPMWDTFRQQERSASLVVLALTILATYQLDSLFSAPLADKHWLRWSNGHLIGTSLVLLIMVGGQLFQYGVVSEATNPFYWVVMLSLLFTGWRIWQARESKTVWIFASLLLLIVVDLFSIHRENGNYLSDTPENRPQLAPILEQLIVEDASDIQYRVDAGVGLQGYGTFYRIPDVYGTGPIWTDAIERLRQIPVDRFWEVLAVRYATLSEAPNPEMALAAVGTGQNLSGETFTLYELPNPRPMAHLVYDYRQAQGNPEFARQIMADERVNLREMAITLAPLPLELPVERPEGAGVREFEMQTPEHITMQVDSPENALLTVAIPNYVGWRAYVNDSRVEIQDTYAGLIGIPIEAGMNQAVRLEFTPSSLKWGALLTVITGVGLMLSLLGDWFFWHKRQVIY